jgi:hypothetical protein
LQRPLPDKALDYFYLWDEEINVQDGVWMDYKWRAGQ